MTTKPRNPKAEIAPTATPALRLPNFPVNLAPSERPAFSTSYMPVKVRTPRPRQSREYMRQTALQLAKTTRVWAIKNKVGTVAATFPEPGQPAPSTKRSCRRKRAAKILPTALMVLGEAGKHAAAVLSPACELSILADPASADPKDLQAAADTLTAGKVQALTDALAHPEVATLVTSHAHLYSQQVARAKDLQALIARQRDVCQCLQADGRPGTLTETMTNCSALAGEAADASNRATKLFADIADKIKAVTSPAAA